MSDAAASPPPDAATDKAILSFIKKALAAHESLRGKDEDKRLMDDKDADGKNGKGEDKVFWYRGQANKDWTLQPGLFRSNNPGSLEERAYKEWVRRADLIEKHEDKEWHHLFNMQHYGVPTRLLDWTESFAVAVGFTLAFSNDAKKSIPKIFI